MVQLYIGSPSPAGRAGGVKVIKNNTDDPNTTPATDYGKFLFNSETTNIGYVSGIRAHNYSAIPAVDGYVYPPGSSVNNSEWTSTYWPDNANKPKYVTYSVNNIGGLAYPFNPLVEVRTRKSNGRFVGPNGRYSVYDQTYPRDAGAQFTYTGLGTAACGYTSGRGYTYEVGPLYDNNTDTRVISVWELPCMNQALASPTATPVSGQENVRISPAIVRIARPGFDIATATGRQLIMDSNRIPAKILKAGQVAISAGSSVTINTGFSLSQNTYVDYNIGFSSGTITWPMVLGIQPNRDYVVGFEYVISGSSVVMYNTGEQTLYVRYMICGDSDAAQTSGGNAVMRSIGDDVQIKRPGSSDSAPGLNDIMLDTRFSYVPIVAEGYLAVSQFTESPSDLLFGEIAKTVSFANTGFIPFLKYTVVYNWTPASGPSETRVRAPYSKLLTGYFMSSQWFGRQAMDGSVAVVTNTSVKFHLAPNNPYWISSSSSNGSTVSDPRNQKPLGIRYYVFGIPTSL